MEPKSSQLELQLVVLNPWHKLRVRLGLPGVSEASAESNIIFEFHSLWISFI